MENLSSYYQKYPLMHTLHMSTQKEEKLAREIADALGDMDSLQVHIGFVERYSETFLRKTLQT